VFTYAVKGLLFDGTQASLLVGTTALGAIVSPLFVGPVADRLFPTQWVLCVLHAIGGLCLLAAGMQSGFQGLYVFLLINTLCFMPTLALSNSLTFRNIDNPDKFPRIMVFGTIGWICASLIVGFLLGETKPWLFYLAGGMELVLAAYCFTLPHTPPKPRGEAAGDVFGFKALRLLKEPSFLMFVVCAFLITIPASFYFNGCNLMLKEKDLPAPTALQAIAQISEIFVMFTMPWFIATMGLRTVLILGMAAWAVRSLLFATMSFPLIVLGLLLHGFAYCFVFVGAYIFVDKKAPQDLKASAQSFISFLMLGVGMFLGSLLSGATIDQYPPYVGTMPAVQEKGEGADLERTQLPRTGLPAWKDIASQLGMDPDDAIALGNLRARAAGGLKVEDTTFAKKHVMVYSSADLEKVLMKIDDRKAIHTRGDFRSATNPNVAFSVNRSDWVAAQLHHWTPMWLWFALAAGVVCVFFAVGSMFASDDDAPVLPSQAEPKPQPAEAPPAAAAPTQPETPQPAAEGGPQPPA
jgi:nucleoside transporter